MRHSIHVPVDRHNFEDVGNITELGTSRNSANNVSLENQSKIDYANKHYSGLSKQFKSM